jgi:glycosyl transferase family 25
MKDVPTFYINRDVDVSRREQLIQYLDAANLPAERVPAVNGRSLPDGFLPLFPPSRLKDGEVGCYASHMLVWREIVARQLPYALVLEDDARFEPAAKDLVSDVLGKLPKGWDYVHLDGRLHSRSFPHRPLAVLSGRSKLVRYARIPHGTAAQLVSLEGARKLLKAVPRVRPVDTDIRMPWLWNLDLYGVTHSPFEHAAFDSPIKKLGGYSKVKTWTGSGRRSLSSFLFNLRKLGPEWWLRCAHEAGSRKLAHFASRHRRSPA